LTTKSPIVACFAVDEIQKHSFDLEKRKISDFNQWFRMFVFFSNMCLEFDQVSGFRYSQQNITGTFVCVGVLQDKNPEKVGNWLRAKTLPAAGPKSKYS
jgi:hypothetical protein